MSVRASLISFFLRRTLKKQMATFEDPADVRQSQRLPGARMPKDMIITSVDAGGVAAEWITPGASADGEALLYLHGGGYVFGGLDSHRDIACRLAQAAGLRVLLIDYRLAPENPFPGAVEDATTAYRWLLDGGQAAERLVVAGDSAGGGLSVALMVQLKALGLPLPKAAVLMSPWVDLANTGDSLSMHADADAMLSPQAMEKFATHYLNGQDPKDPLASPLYADLSGLPPTQVLVGSEEVLLSDSERLVERIRSAGGSAEIAVWPKMPHVFPILADVIPEGRQAIEDMSGFIRSNLSLS
jgi:acetyl esterase/lipase